MLTLPIISPIASRYLLRSVSCFSANKMLFSSKDHPERQTEAACLSMRPAVA